MSVLTAYELADKKHMLSRSEVDLIKRFCRQLPEQPVLVNIGAGAGTSVLAMLEARPKAFIFSIDKRVVPAEQEALIKAGHPRRCVRVLGDSSRIGRYWPYPIDLVFIDGDHTDRGVTDDALAWRSHVRPGGFILFHDYHHPNLPRLSGIVDRLMSDYPQVGTARYLVAFQVPVDQGNGEAIKSDHTQHDEAVRILENMIEFSRSPFVQDDHGRDFCFFCVGDNNRHEPDCAFIEAVKFLEGRKVKSHAS